VLFCALCHIQSLFAICRNLQRCPDDRTVAAAAALFAEPAQAVSAFAKIYEDVLILDLEEFGLFAER